MNSAEGTERGAGPMDEKRALSLHQHNYGSRAAVRTNNRFSATHYEIGLKWGRSFQVLGRGLTWEEAFEDQQRNQEGLES